MAILRARGIAALAAAVLFLAACSGGGSADDGPGAVFIRSLPTGSAVPAASMTLTPTPEPTFTPTLEPAATALPLSPTTTPPSPPPTLAPTNEEPSSPTPAAPLGEGASAELSPESVPQGGVFVVRLRNASVEPTPVVFFSGVSHAMLLQAQLWWAVIGVAADFPPGQQLVQISTDTDGSPILTINVTDAAFPEENVELPPETSQLLTDAPAIEDENQILNSLYAGLTPERLWSGPFIMPAVGPLGDTFGYRRSFNGGPYSNHTGVDILAAEGAPVVAANTGRVVYTGALQLRGNTVVIDHGAGVFTGYHHLSQIYVTQGQAVVQGETIGAVGATGLVTGPHLHWELIVRGVRVDPLPWTQAEIAP
jgi:murein DD-endopeptidase MepM/ murein hydrolase activator NlpD